jgi:hypothetical protein
MFQKVKARSVAFFASELGKSRGWLANQQLRCGKG